MSKAYEKPISESVHKLADRLKIDPNKEPVKYPLVTFILLPAFVWAALESLGLQSIFAFLLAMPYPLFMGYKMYLWFQLQEGNPRPISYKYDDETPFHIKYGTAIILCSVALIAISVFLILPKTMVGGGALILLAAFVLWKTTTEGREYHKHIQETHGIERIDQQG